MGVAPRLAGGRYLPVHAVAGADPSLTLRMTTRVLPRKRRISQLASFRASGRCRSFAHAQDDYASVAAEM